MRRIGWIEERHPVYEISSGKVIEDRGLNPMERPVAFEDKESLMLTLKNGRRFVPDTGTKGDQL